MGVDQARMILIIGSLCITGAQCLFLLIAPVFGYPLQYPENLDILQIIAPVWLGYLGSATHFAFQTQTAETTPRTRFVGVLTVGPLAIYTIIVSAALFSFGYLNRQAAAPGQGLSKQDLARAMASALGLLAVTTGVITGKIFASTKLPMN